MKTEVIKRDGTKEIYDETKIVKVAIAVGLEEKAAMALSIKITSWLKSNPSRQVTSLQIRDEFLKLLKEENKAAADLFSWYEATKD